MTVCGCNYWIFPSCCCYYCCSTALLLLLAGWTSAYGKQCSRAAAHRVRVSVRMCRGLPMHMHKCTSGWFMRALRSVYCGYANGRLCSMSNATRIATLWCMRCTTLSDINKRILFIEWNEMVWCLLIVDFTSAHLKWTCCVSKPFDWQATNVELIKSKYLINKCGQILSNSTTVHFHVQNLFEWTAKFNATL